MANEKRSRTNNVGGLIEDNPLTNVATTLTSAALSALPVIDTTNHAVIVLDPDGLEGAPEIVYVTAHTSGATTATIVRAQEGSSGLQHSVDVPWVHTATVLDFLEPWAVDITPLTARSASVGTFQLASWTGEGVTYPWGGTGLTDAAGAPQNDYLQWAVVLSAGLWSITLHTRKSTNVAIYNCQLDGVSMGTYDGYAAAVAYGTTTFTGVAATAGLHQLKLLAATKNASSSSYVMNVFGVSLLRTT